VKRGHPTRYNVDQNPKYNPLCVGVVPNCKRKKKLKTQALHEK